ncbi:MAG: hypothetical protein ACRD6X_17480 [Pyrinomonadaceae bacterium]
MISIVVGVILIAIGVVGYIHGLSNEKASVTALIPAFLGILMAIFGAVANSKESLRKHLMHGSVLVALLGFIATSARLIPRIGEFNGSAAQLSQLSTAVVCLAFIIFAVRSFISARGK